MDELLDQSRRQLATLVPVSDRAAAMGDVAVVSFSGVFSDDKSAIEGGSANGLDVELEEGRMISGFVEGVVGMKPGDKKDVDCQFPDDYPKRPAAGARRCSRSASMSSKAVNCQRSTTPSPSRPATKRP